MPLRHLPLIFPLAFFVLGIVIAGSYCISTTAILGASCACILLFVFAKSAVLKGLSLWFIFLILGSTITEIGAEARNASHFSSYEASELLIKVSSRKRTKKGYGYEANAMRADSILVRGKIMIYSDSTLALKPYHSYIIPANYNDYEKYSNPGHFDYATYLASRQIFHRAYLSDPPLSTIKPVLIERLIASTGEYITRHFTTSFQFRSTTDLVNAILLGRKGAMDDASRKLFVENGLAHLLAISGMHVGIIFMILNFLFSSIPLPWIRKLLILCGIWFYVVLTGVQVPAIRAAFMLSVFILGQLSSRNVKGLNSIFTAALVMLAINPSMLYQVSFQMSFGAMCSIMIFYSPILNLFHFERKWASQLWQLTALNISVQFLVLPIAIFYFKQVPTYSLLTSLVSIPFIVVIMWGAIISLALSPLLFLSTFMDQVLEGLISFYLNLLQAFSKLPYALISIVEIHYIQLVFWVMGSVSFIILYQMNAQKISRYFMSFVPLVVFSSMIAISSDDKSYVTVYDAKEGIVIDHVENGRSSRFRKAQEVIPYFLRSSPAGREIELVEDENIELPGLTMRVLSKKQDFANEETMSICILNNGNLLDPAYENALKQACSKIVIPRNLKVNNIPKSYYDIKTRGAFTLKI